MLKPHEFRLTTQHRCWVEGRTTMNPERFRPNEISGIEPLNPRAVGRVTPCAPGVFACGNGAHGVSRPALRFMERVPSTPPNRYLEERAGERRPSAPLRARSKAVGPRRSTSGAKSGSPGSSVTSPEVREDTQVLRRKQILLVDDHPMTRAGLAQLINKQPDLEVCCEAGNAS